MPKILGVFAHPDDETFGPGSTIAKYATEGAEIHLLCATRGEAGQWSAVLPNGRKLGSVREQEHKEAAQILGIKKTVYLDYIDGTLSNDVVSNLVDKVVSYAKEFNPQIILTFDPLGLSGHIDHITMSIVATKAFEKVKSVKKLYYFTQDKMVIDWSAKLGFKMWTLPPILISTTIDVQKYLPTKMKAAACHKTQAKDFNRLKWAWKIHGQKDNFILAGNRTKSSPPETDLFAALDR